MRTYVSGKWSIMRGQTGINHGVEWGLWRGGELWNAAATLRECKRIAEREGVAKDSWRVETVAARKLEVVA